MSKRYEFECECDKCRKLAIAAAQTAGIKIKARKTFMIAVGGAGVALLELFNKMFRYVDEEAIQPKFESYKCYSWEGCN